MINNRNNILCRRRDGCFQGAGEINNFSENQYLAQNDNRGKEEYQMVAAAASF
jgi:hypothetical protein